MGSSNPSRRDYDDDSDEEEEDRDEKHGTVVADDVTFIANPNKAFGTSKSDRSSKSTLTHKRGKPVERGYSLKTWYRAIGKSKWSSPLTSLYLTIQRKKNNAEENRSSGSEEEEKPEYEHVVLRKHSFSDDENKITINIGAERDSPSNRSIVFVGGDSNTDDRTDFNNNTYRKPKVRRATLRSHMHPF